MKGINSALTLLKQKEEEDNLAYQKDFADMVRQQKRDQYDNLSLEIALKSLRISKWNLFFVILTLLISLCSMIH